MHGLFDTLSAPPFYTVFWWSMCIQILVCKCSLECKLEILVEQNLIQVRKIALSPQVRVIVLWEIIRQRE